MSVLEDDWRRLTACVVASEFGLVQRLERNVQQLDDLREVRFYNKNKKNDLITFDT